MKIRQNIPAVLMTAALLAAAWMVPAAAEDGTAAEAAGEAASEEEMVGGMTGMPNPWTDTDTLADAQSLAGVSFRKLPVVDGYETLVYRAMEGEMLEVIYYDEEGNEGLRIRKAPGTDDISGVYDDSWMNAVISADYEEYSVQMRGHATDEDDPSSIDRIYVATWSMNENGSPYAYAIDVQEAVLGVPEMTELVEFMNSGLPVFTCNHEDADVPYMAAICEYLVSEYSDEYSAVTIPAPYVMYVDDTDPSAVKVWGNFWTCSYDLERTTLNSMSGGEAPGIMELTVDQEGQYTVTSFRSAGDGDQYAEDIRAFCEEAGSDQAGHLEELFLESSDLRAEPVSAVRTEFIEQYVDDNALEIDSYKDYGWDPVMLDTGE